MCVNFHPKSFLADFQPVVGLWARDLSRIKKKLDIFGEVYHLQWNHSSAMQQTTHIPIFLDEVIGSFRLTAGRTFLDGTLGGCGHAAAILQAFPMARLWAMDVDPAAIERGKNLLPADRATIIHGNFSNLDQLDRKNFDGILLDIGVSSDQLDTPERGFSFRSDGPLDMRMDPSQGISASQFLKTATREELIHAIRDFGEEPCWRRVVDAIVDARKTPHTLERTTSFANLMCRVLPSNYRSKVSPVTRTFQGIRIAINGELSALEYALPKAFAALNPCGVIAILTFHSLEDRIVKQHFRNWAGMSIDRHDGRSQQDRFSHGRILTPKPIVPSRHELNLNPRSRSAKLRLFQKKVEDVDRK
ncbi:MAG: 16S rRNA (cytosine(1402)-N(4))-methyltransferase RsmH [Puniceicoccales bacterium]|jgi:16S rRNA (cytosine1402-N4)-methyltransferase|nr:16S rRNA (cytosine(1402)-N(4))-methyltransferase RsmH [Puniceicoccales bacterium]